MTASSGADRRPPAGVSGIVTPEAVVLEFETSGLPSRMLAALIDLTVQTIVLFGALALAGALAGAGLEFGGIAVAAFYVLLFLIIFGYPCGFETLWRGRTPGKAALGLRVVTIEGGPIRFRHAAIRAILGLVDKFLLSGTIGVLSLLLTRQNQRLGDLVAGTIVLRERAGLRAPQAVAFSAPPGLEHYVATLDVARLGNEEYGTVRSFLLRVSTLSPAARFSLAQQLATPLAQRLNTVPPTGLHPEMFLVCVAAAFQRRNARAGAPTRPAFASIWTDVAAERGR